MVLNMDKLMRESQKPYDLRRDCDSKFTATQRREILEFDTQSLTIKHTGKFQLEPCMPRDLFGPSS